jgi:hypothetical protein
VSLAVATEWNGMGNALQLCWRRVCVVLTTLVHFSARVIVLKAVTDTL